MAILILECLQRLPESLLRSYLAGRGTWSWRRSECRCRRAQRCLSRGERGLFLRTAEKKYRDEQGYQCHTGQDRTQSHRSSSLLDEKSARAVRAPHGRVDTPGHERRADEAPGPPTSGRARCYRHPTSISPNCVIGTWPLGKWTTISSVPPRLARLARSRMIYISV